MKHHDTPTAFRADSAVNFAPDLAQLVGKIYEDAATGERQRMLACLLRPLGILAVFGVANGVFARILFRDGLHAGYDRLADIGEIRANHVIALVDYVQQLGADSLEGLGQMLSASPLMTCSGACALLVTAYFQSARSRQAGATPATPYLVDPVATPNP